MSLHLSRRTLLTRAAPVAAGCVVLPSLFRSLAASGLSTLTLTSLDRVVPGWLEKFAVPGASAALILKGRVNATRRWGVKKLGEPNAIAAETVFEAASLSKPVFVSIVLQLAEEKRLDLDEPLAEFFREPDLRDEPRIAQLTPRIVLSHRTGLQNWRPPREPLRIRFDPGTDFSYSGESYVRLQRAVEKKTAKSLTELAQTYVFDPLGMKRSSFVWRADYESTAAEGHDVAGRAVRTRLWGWPNSSQAQASPPGVDIPIFAVPNAAASLYCTPADYAQFMAALMELPRAWKFSEASRKLMFTPLAKVTPSIAWGLGWGLSPAAGVQTFWHWGNNGPYQGFAVGSLEQKSGLVLLTNSASGLKLCREAVNAAYGAEHPAFAWRMVLPQ